MRCLEQTADDRGRFRHREPWRWRAGTSRSGLGYQLRFVQVEVSGGETVDASVELRRMTQMLDTMRVVSRGSLDKPARLDYTMKYDLFYQRRRIGLGSYLTREQIDSMPNVTRASDIVNRIPLLRTEQKAGYNRCRKPTVYINGLRTTEDRLGELEATEVEAVEYYRGLSSGSVGAFPCTLHVWTR